MSEKEKLSRRDLLVLTGASAGGLALAGWRLGEDGAADAATVPLRLLITEMPVGLYNKRKVLDEADAPLSRMYRWYTYELNGARPEHHYSVRTRRTPGFIEVSVDIALQNKLWKSIEAKYTSARPLKRLWISRGYLHGEERTTACFPARALQKPFQGDVWFATFQHANHTLASETRRRFQYRRPARGHVELPLHAGFSYFREWTTHRDGIGHDYVTRFLRKGALMAEIRETVFGLRVMRDRACTALATATYCDTDDI